MDVKKYRRRNVYARAKERLRHPWPLYKRAGGLEATVIRADGTTENLGKIATQYVRRRGWSMTAGPK